MISKAVKSDIMFLLKMALFTLGALIIFYYLTGCVN